MAALTSLDRQTFRETVAMVAAKAKAKLPEAVNGRVESAVKLVLAHDVLFLEDGTIEVGSSSDPLKTYTLAGHACDCQDFAYGKAPEGWCQHRIAAGIAKRVAEQLAAQDIPEPEDQVYDDKLETSPAPPAPETVGIPLVSPTPTPLPEAPASVNVRVTIGGREVQWTLRDTDEARLATRLEALLARYPLQQAASQPTGQLSPQQYNAAAMHKRVTDFCPVHGVQMKENQKDGRTWYSHYDEAAGRWCKGK